MKPFDWEQSAYLGYMVEQYENAQAENDNNEDEDSDKEELFPLFW